MVCQETDSTDVGFFVENGKNGWLAYLVDDSVGLKSCVRLTFPHDENDPAVEIANRDGWQSPEEEEDTDCEVLVEIGGSRALDEELADAGAAPDARLNGAAPRRRDVEQIDGDEDTEDLALGEVVVLERVADSEEALGCDEDEVPDADEHGRPVDKLAVPQVAQQCVHPRDSCRNKQMQRAAGEIVIAKSCRFATGVRKTEQK